MKKLLLWKCSPFSALHFHKSIVIGYHAILNVFVKPFVAFNHVIKVIKDIWLLSSVESRKCTYNRRYDKWNFNSKHYTQLKTFKKLNISHFIVIFPLHSQSNKSYLARILGWVCLAVGVSGTRLHLVVVDNNNITVLVCNNQFKSTNTCEYNLPESYEV